MDMSRSPLLVLEHGRLAIPAGVTMLLFKRSKQGIGILTAHGITVFVTIMHSWNLYILRD